MLIHTDRLTARDLVRALYATVPEAELDVLELRGSRSHARAFKVRLGVFDVPDGGRDRHGTARRARNSGLYGAGAPRSIEAAATYDEWGDWLSLLFDVEPTAKTSYYRNRADFHRSTEDRFRVPGRAGLGAAALTYLPAVR